MRPAARLRWAFAVIIFVAIAHRAATALVFEGALDGEAEPNYELFSKLSWARAVLDTGAWLVALRAVVRLRAHGATSAPLNLVLGGWGVAFAIDLASYALPFMSLDIDTLVTVSTWFGRVAVVGMAVGAYGAIVHARATGAKGEATAIATIGLVVYIGVGVMFSFPDLLEFESNWAQQLLAGLGLVGIFGGMMILPWDTIDGDLPADDAPAREGKNDLLAGSLWFGGGLALTLFSMQGDGIGGRAVLAYGPMIYGLFRLLRGFTR